MHRLAWVSISFLVLAGCESGTSSGPAAIAFTPAPAPSGQGFVALYAPPVDVGPYPNDIYNPVAALAGPTLDVPEKITSPLAAAVNTLDGFSTVTSGADFDPTRIHHVSMSLGSAFSSVYLGLNGEAGSATMSSPFATWSRILTDPEAVTFGAPLRAGLAAQGLVQGTTGFDNFIRDLQTVLDSADPANYAAAATAMHPIHVIEILGDDRVPNGPTDFIADLWGLADVTAASPVLFDAGGANGIVRFTAGEHGSLLDPTPAPLVTVEMQAQMVTFAVTAGTTIAITDTSVVQ